MNGYVKEMRALIGTRPLMVCGASVIVVAEGRVLLQKRRDNGCWGYHGGSLELGERAQETARRELEEETGLRAEELELFDVFSGPELHYVYPHGDEVHIVDVVYVCRRTSGALCGQGSEVKELRWFPLEQLPENISPPQVAPLRAFVLAEQTKTAGN